MKGDDKMKQIPENNDDVRKILREQIALLAEESEKHKYEPRTVTELSDAMNKLTVTLFTC